MRGRPNNNRRGPNPLTRSYESNGPDVKIRGNAHHIAEKYLQLARDAHTSGDPVAAENYLQHAEHYFRLIATAQAAQLAAQGRPPGEPEPEDTEEDDDGGVLDRFASPAERAPAFPPPQQPQPYVRDNKPREQRGDGQPYRDQQPREHHREREHRPQPQYQPQPQSQPQPVIADTGGGVDRLPSFITGPQPQVNGAPGGYEEGRGGERFPRRRRRPHGPRPEGMAAPAAPSEDFNPGNE